MKALFAKGKAVADEQSRVCLLFDPKNGRIAHVHGITILDDRDHLTDLELESKTIAHAVSLGHSAAGLRALHVPISAIRQRGVLKVNAQGTGVEAIAGISTRSREGLTKLR